MQDMLVPIFGENGAIIIQYVITLAVILGLIALIVWAIRRYGSRTVGPTARGRLPRLAVVDALAIDNKRRLVLVRRDNVEHLVLIGGPTDVVVEPSIVRQRVAQRPGQPTPAARATQPPTAAPQPPPPPPAPSSQTTAQAAPRVLPTRTPVATADPTENAIPFPPRRSPLRAAERFLSPRRESTRTAMAASAVAASDPLADTAVARRSPTTAMPEEEPEAVVAEQASSRFAAPARFVLEESDEPVPGYPPDREDDQETVSAFAPPAAAHHPAAEPEAEPQPQSDGPGDSLEIPSAPPTAEAEPPEAAARPAEVSDLEKEMARLLDEISTSRRE
jgi:hypothetical protein